MASHQAFLDRIEDLTDLELAVLLSLIAQHHFIVNAKDDLLDDLASELALVRFQWSTGRKCTKLMPRQIARDIFQLSYIILDRDDLQSVDRFGDAILDDDNDDEHCDDDQGFKDTDDIAESVGFLLTAAFAFPDR